jgi:hypothetical protein
MALPDQIGFPAFSISRRLHTKNFINSTVWQSAVFFAL